MPEWEMMAAIGSGEAGTVGTRYSAPLGALIDAATEVNAQILARGTYTRANFFAVATAVTGTVVISSRKNSGAGAMSLSITATGITEDTTNSDSLVDGDLFNDEWVLGAGEALTLTVLGSTLDGTGNIPIIGSYSFSSINFGVTRFSSLVGSFANEQTTEASRHFTVNTAATYSNFRGYVSQYSLNSGNSVTTLRKNAADAGPSLTFTAVSAVEDTTNTATYAAGDEAAVQTVNGGTSGTVGYNSVQTKSNAIERPLFSSSLANTGITADAYVAAEGRLVSTATESQTQKTARSSFTAKNMQVNVTTGTTTNPATIYLRKNGANSALEVAVPNSTTGIVMNTTDSDTFVDGDEYNYFVDHTGDNITLYNIGFELEPTALGGHPTMRRWGGVHNMARTSRQRRGW